MGSSYSRGPRTTSSVKSTNRKKGSSKSKNKDTSIDSSTPAGGTASDIENNVESRAGKIVHERKDSKKFWISHVRFRRSSSDLRRTSTEKKPEMRKTPETTPAKQTHQYERDSKTALHKKVSSDSPEGTTLQGSLLHDSASGRNDNVEGVKSKFSEFGGNCEKHSVVTNDNTSGAKYRSMTVVELYNILNDGALSPCICNPAYILLLDTRSKQCYEESHVSLARPSSSLYSDIQSYNYMHGFSTSTDISNTINEFTWIIIYGDPIDLQGDDIEERPEVKLYNELEGDFDVEPCILSTGFTSFENAFPFLCTNEKVLDFKKLQVYPSMILDNQLFQGRGDQATNIKVIEDLKITHIVNITQEHKSAFPEKVEYFTLKLDDVPQTQLLKHFERTSAFLVNAISSGGRALVHCNLGVSRSSSVSIAYLIQSRGWTLQMAHDHIKERRTCIRPNRGFLQQLSAWEVVMLGKKYTDPDDLWF
jgi:protein-tyrosine phosphatase